MVYNLQWAKYIKEKRVLGKYTIDKSIYTKINNIEKSGQILKEERAFILYIYYRENTYIYKKDVLYFYIRNQSGAKIKKGSLYRQYYI